MPTDQSGRPPEELDVQQIKFVGEQDGPVEQRLKQKLSELFLRDRSVDKAYLARAIIDGGPTVVLALQTEGGDEPRLAEQVGSTFASIFSANQHLDVVFLSDEQHAKVRGVCRSFFDR